MRAHTSLRVRGNGFVSVGTVTAKGATQFCEFPYLRRIGRQAPVKRCLARSSFRLLKKPRNDVAGLSPRLSSIPRLTPGLSSGITRAATTKLFHPYGSIWRRVRTSASLTSVSFFSLRIRPGFLVPSKCRLPECIRLIFPVPVILKRFRAPRWVFNFFFGFVEFLGIPFDSSRRVRRERRTFSPPPVNRQARKFCARSYMQTRKNLRSVTGAARGLPHRFHRPSAFFRRQQSHQHVAFHPRRSLNQAAFPYFPE